MKTTNGRLVDWAISRIETEYKDEVCLLIGHNTLKLEKDVDESSLSFFIPASENAYGLAKTFIIDGIGYDLFPMSWERIEGLAELNEYNTSCLGEALYIPKDKERKKWGEGSGARIFFSQRNEEIRNKFFHKVPIEDLAEEYFLSVETIRKIVYK